MFPCSCLECLNPEKVNIFLVAKDYKELVHSKETEPWFGTKFAREEIPQEWKTQWNKEEMIEGKPGKSNIPGRASWRSFRVILFSAWVCVLTKDRD